MSFTSRDHGTTVARSLERDAEEGHVMEGEGLDECGSCLLAHGWLSKL